MQMAGTTTIAVLTPKVRGLPRSHTSGLRHIWGGGGEGQL